MSDGRDERDDERRRASLEKDAAAVRGGLLQFSFPGRVRLMIRSGGFFTRHPDTHLETSRLAGRFPGNVSTAESRTL